MPTELCYEKIRGAERCALRVHHKGNHRSLPAIERRLAVLRETRMAA